MSHVVDSRSDNQPNDFRSTAGTCDQAGCDFNSFRMGDTSFYGPGLTVDTKQKITVVTQFVGSPISQINRFYVQNGNVIPNSQSTVAGVTGNSISDSFCAARELLTRWFIDSLLIQ
jgi:cellulose 1,4-beta-cellobiosidase